LRLHYFYFLSIELCLAYVSGKQNLPVTVNVNRSTIDCNLQSAVCGSNKAKTSSPGHDCWF